MRYAGAGEFRAEYGAEFNPVYPDLAQKYDLAFYPFFLQDVALVPRYNQRDGSSTQKGGKNH